MKHFKYFLVPALLSILLSVGIVPTLAMEFTRLHANAVATSAALPKDAVFLKHVGSIGAKRERLQIPTGQGTWTLELEKFDVLTPEAVVVKGTHDGDVHIDVPHHAMYRGRVVERANSRVFLAAFDDYISAMIEIDEPGGQRRWMIAPDTLIPGRKAVSIFYEVREIPGEPEACHAEELPDYQERSDRIMKMISGDPSFNKPVDKGQASTVYSLHLALDCAYSYYLRHDTSITYAAQYALTLAGACSAIYQRDANVQVQVPFLRVWTVEDPWAAPAIGDRLNNVRRGWDTTMRHIQRSTVCYLSGQGGGGLAWVGVLCGGFGYNVSGVGGKVNFPATGYIWDIDVTSHELGHNIGSSHTHNCNWAPPIDSCWNAEGGCYDGTMPQRGTIMSYCHLQWKGTALQFHPRVASLFNRVMERTACMAPVTNGHDSDVAVVDIIEPANGAVIEPTRPFTPRVVIRNTGAVSQSSIQVSYFIVNLNNDTVATAQRVEVQLAPGAARTVSFPSKVLSTAGTYVMMAEVVADDDTYATNNQLTRPFHIGAESASSVAVVFPNGGQSLRGGDTVRVRFTATGVDNVHLTFSADNGLTWQNVKSVVKATDGSYLWTVPAIVTSTALMKVTSTDNAGVTDVSNGVFSIDVGYEVALEDVTIPETNDTLVAPFEPNVVIRNLGIEGYDSLQVSMTIRWVRRAQPSYDTTIWVYGLAPRAVKTIVLPSTGVLSNGVHVVTAKVIAAKDANPDNNVYTRSFLTKDGMAAPYSVRVEHGPKRVLIQWAVDQRPGQRVEIWRGTSAATMQRVLSLAQTVTSWIDEGLSDDVEYTYALRCVIEPSLETSDFTDLLLATPKTYPHGFDLAPAQVISPKNNVQNVPLPTDLVWSSVRGADRYEVQVADAPSMDETSMQYVIITDNDDAVPAPVRINQKPTWYWRVRAINDSYTGPWSETASFGPTKGCADFALRLNGTDGRATNDTMTWKGGPVTIEFWQYLRREDRGNMSTFSFGATDQGRNRLQAHVPWGDGNIYFDYGAIADSGRVVGAYNGAYDRWAHIALVTDASTFMSIYVDGNLVASRKGAMQATNLTSFTIGAMQSQHFLKGQVDEFRIWTVARTQDQIRRGMTSVLDATDKAGLYAQWSFREGSGRTAADNSGAGRDLTLSTTAEFVESGATIACDRESVLQAPPIASQPQPLNTKHQYMIEWPGVSGASWYDVEVFDTDSDQGTPIHRIYNVQVPRVEVGGLPEGQSLAYRVRARSTTARSPWRTGTIVVPAACESMIVDLQADTSYFVVDSLWYRGRATTVEYWSFVRTNDLGNRSTFNIGETDPTERRFQAHAPWSDKTLYWDHGNQREGGRLTFDMSNYFDRWNHIALVSNGQDQMHIYINAQRVATTDFATAPGVMRRLAIGANVPSNFQYKGLMSDLRVWNIQRTAEQIRSSMYERIVGPRSHLLGSWTLDDGRGSMAEDVSSHALDGVARKSPKWVPDTTRSLMHVPPAVRGPIVVTKGDTATYTLHTDLSADVTWRAVDGVILGKPDPRTVLVQWVTTSAAGQLCVTRTFPSGCKDSSCTFVYLNDPVSVDDDVVSGGEQVRIAPNPANSTVSYFVGRDAVVDRVEIYSMLGARVASFERGATTVMIDHLASGTYYVQAVVDGVVITHPLVVTR